MFWVIVEWKLFETSCALRLVALESNLSLIIALKLLKEKYRESSHHLKKTYIINEINA